MPDRRRRGPPPPLWPARPRRRADRPEQALHHLPALDPSTRPVRWPTTSSTRGDLEGDDPASGSRRWSRLHVKKHGGDVERSLADVPAAPSTRDGLAPPAQPRHGGESPAPRAARQPWAGALMPTARPVAPSATATSPTASGSASSGPTPAVALGTVFSGDRQRAAPARSPSSRSSTSHADDPVSRAQVLAGSQGGPSSLEHPGDRPGVWPRDLCRRPAVLRHAVHPAATASRRRSTAFTPPTSR